MWLTGFDAPSLHTLYIDKPMRGHGLMQAIARVNRVWGDKPGGLIVDYLGIGAELRAALAQYTARDRDQVRLDPDEAVRQTLMRLESAQALLEGAPWRDFFGAGPAARLTVLKQCLEHVLASGRRDEFIETATELETAYALSAGDERVTARRDEIALIAAIRVNLVKYTPAQDAGARASNGTFVSLLSRAVMADGILDVFKSAGLDQPDLAVLSDEFLAEVRQTKEKNLAVETLRRLLADEIKARSRSNIVQASKLSERLDETLRRYHNRAVDSLQVIEELIALAKDIRAVNARASNLGLQRRSWPFTTLWQRTARRRRLWLMSSCGRLHNCWCEQSGARQQSIGRGRKACEQRCASRSASFWRVTAIPPTFRRPPLILSFAKPKSLRQIGHSWANRRKRRLSPLHQFRHDLRRIIDHRHDARVIQPRRTDDAEHADDFLGAVAERRGDHRGAGERKQLVLRADEDAHPFAGFGARQEIDDVLLGFEIGKQQADALEIFERRQILEEIGLSAHDQLLASRL